MKKIQIYAGEVLAYDNRLPVEKRYNLLEARTAEEVNKGGTLTIIMAPDHPCYDLFNPLTTQVELRENGHVRWRGRALPAENDFAGRRKIVCEGELCFFQDVTHRPHAHEGTPAEVFAAVMQEYNSRADPWKRFTVGQCTVKDPNNYIRLARENPETFYDSLQGLIKLLGGFFIFDSAPDGSRRINWFEKCPYTSTQKIKFGENLMDYLSNGDLDNFATRIVPYGAVQEGGGRLQINVDGKDYVENAEAVALRGVIEKPMVYDKITTADALLRRATEDVHRLGMLPRRITLDALDLSATGENLQEEFYPGQRLQCISPRHNLRGWYNLLAMEKDWLSPSTGTVTLYDETASVQDVGSGTITEAVATGNKNNSQAVVEVSSKLQGDLQIDIAAVKRDFKSELSQTAEGIRQEVSQTMTQTKQDINQDVEKQISAQNTTIEQMSDSLTVKIEKSSEQIREVDGRLQSQYDEIAKVIRATLEGIIIGESGSDTQLRLDNDIIEMLVAGLAAMTIDRTGMKADQVTVREIRLGKYILKAAENGHIVLL